MIADLKPYAAMKDSGVPWLGEVPEHWNMERAKCLFRKVDRPVRDTDDVVTCFRDGTVTLRKNRRVRGFTESLKEIGYQGIRRGDLVIHAMDAFAGAIGVADADGKGTPVYSVCEPADSASAHFYAYTLREMARSQWIQALAKGIRERSTDFRFGAFGSQLLAVPPLSEQAAIVRFLDYADRRIRRYIRAKQKLIKLLEEQKQAIIHQAVTCGLDPNVRLKPSGVEWLGDVPEHWEIVRSGSIFRLFGGFAFAGSGFVRDEVSEQLPVLLTPVNFDPAGGLRFGPGFTVKFRGHVPSQFVLRKHDLVTVLTDLSAKRLILARAGFIETDGVLLNQRTARVEVHETVRSSILNSYLFWVLNCSVVRQQTMATGRGSTVFHTSPTRMLAAQWPLPPLEEQRTICGELEDAEKLSNSARDRLRKEIQLLQEFHTRLIADVVTGKLDVREAAAKLPDELEPVEDGDSAATPEDTLEDSLDSILEEAET